MELHVVTKFSIFRHKADVTDMNGNIVYKLKGRFMSPTQVISLYDTNKVKKYKIRNQFFHAPFTRTAIIYDTAESNTKIAKIRQKFSMVNNFTVMGNINEISIKGDIIGWNFNVFKDGTMIGNIQAQISMFGHYVINVDNDSDAEFVLAVFAAVANIRRKNSKK